LLARHARNEGEEEGEGEGGDRGIRPVRISAYEQPRVSRGIRARARIFGSPGVPGPPLPRLNALVISAGRERGRTRRVSAAIIAIIVRKGSIKRLINRPRRVGRGEGGV